MVPFIDTDKSLACVHCGLCLGSCPTYLETGNENDSPRGRIYLMRALQDGRLPLSKTAVHHLDLCLGCRACEVACPSGVQYGELLEGTRDHIEKNYRRPVFDTFLRRVVIEQIFPYPSRMRLALLPANLIKRAGAEHLLPELAREALALVPDEQDMESLTLPEISPATGPVQRGRVGVVSGCVMSVMFARTNVNTVELLNRAGADVFTPRGQGCCGALFAHSGKLADARACARHNIQVFEKLELDAVIINAAGCGSTLKEYGHLLHGEPQWEERGRRFSAKVKDLTEWLVESGFLKSIQADHSDSTKVTYHDACHLAHPQRITKQPRDLVKAVAGKNYVELLESDVCCGSAGSYNLTEPAMAKRLRSRKIENILKTGAELVVTTNPGCLLQIRAGVAAAGAHQIRAMHIADYLILKSSSVDSRSKVALTEKSGVPARESV